MKRLKTLVVFLGPGLLLTIAAAWLISQHIAAQSAAEAACVHRGYTPVINRRGDVVCVVGAPDVHPIKR